MQIVKGKGLGSQCQECSRSNIPVLQIKKSAYIIRYCQRCLREAFRDYAQEQQWKENKRENTK